MSLSKFTWPKFFSFDLLSDYASRKQSFSVNWGSFSLRKIILFSYLGFKSYILNPFGVAALYVAINFAKFTGKYL